MCYCYEVSKGVSDFLLRSYQKLDELESHLLHPCTVKCLNFVDLIILNWPEGPSPFYTKTLVVFFWICHGFRVTYSE